MIKYELIREYPGSEKLGHVEWYNFNSEKLMPESSNNWQGTYFYDKHPKFWQKVEEVNYEILTVTPSDKNLNNTNKEAVITFKMCNKDLEMWDIHSVKRLSDGEIFTIGDKTNVKYSVQNVEIIKFQISEKDSCWTNGLWVYFDNVSCNLSQISKAKKTPLFTTEDGVDIFEGNKVFYVENHTQGWCQIANYFKHIDGRKYFYTKEKLEDYILMNKPCLSIKDVAPHLRDMISFMGIKEMVKSKL